MRALRLTLAGTVIMALLGGVGAPVVAQGADEELAGATYVVGEVTDTRTISEGTWTYEGVERLNDLVAELDVEWSDPRLPSLMRLSENQDLHFMDDYLAVAAVASIRLEDPDGAWTGPEYGLMELMGSKEGTPPWPRMMLLTGERAYEGLSAMLQRRYEPDDPTFARPVFEGYIFEHGLTPMPSAPEAASD